MLSGSTRRANPRRPSSQDHSTRILSKVKVSVTVKKLKKVDMGSIITISYKKNYVIEN